MKRTRRISALMLTLMFVLTFFFSTSAIALERAEKVAPKSEATPIKKNTASEIKKIKDYTLKMCDFRDPTDDRFAYAKMVPTKLSTDWKVKSGHPAALYKYPYSIDCIEYLPNYSQFLSNKQLLTKTNSATVNEWLRLARALGAFETNENTSPLDEDEIAQKAMAAVCPDLVFDGIKAVREGSIKHKFQSKGAFITDKSLVYQAVDGTIRVRGRLFLSPITGSKEALKSMGNLTLGEWYYADKEFIIQSVDTTCEWLGLKKWTSNKYSVISGVDLHWQWRKASKSQIEWYKKNGGTV